MMLKWIILLLQVLTINCELEDGISYIVRPGKIDCFYRHIEVGATMDFDLQVLSGGDLDISMVIKSPSGKELLREVKEAEISKEIIIVENGSHEICFDNSFSTFSDKVVYFDLGITDSGVGHHDISKEYTLPKDEYENVDELWKSLDTIGNNFEHLTDMQAIFRSKYKRHEFIQDSNLRKVTWFSISSSILMIFIGILQVILIKNLFKPQEHR